MESNSQMPISDAQTTDSFDYSYVANPARVALYDDMKAAPRISKIEPNTTAEFIESLTTVVYDLSHTAGGKIPYTVIREVTENFIHAQFSEVVVSILDEGNTIRFADQGPGIPEKDKAQKPGFSSAIEPMKDYIRGVGSGLPIVKDYFDEKEGYITIEDNLMHGAVVTISLLKKEDEVPRQQTPEPVQAAPELRPEQPRRDLIPIPLLSGREKTFISIMAEEGMLGVTELANLADCPMSSTHNTLGKLEELGLVEKIGGKKRQLTELGIQIARAL